MIEDSKKTMLILNSNFGKKNTHSVKYNGWLSDNIPQFDLFGKEILDGSLF